MIYSMTISHNDSRDTFEILEYQKERVDAQMGLDTEFINFYDTDNDGYYFAKSGIKWIMFKEIELSSELDKLTGESECI